MTAKPKHKTNHEPRTEKPAQSANPTIVVAVITGVVTVIVALINVLNPQFITSLMQFGARPTATPIPFARVQTIEVIHASGSTESINPNGTITLEAGANVLIKANVVTNTDLNALIFSWEFCHPEKNTKGQGAVQIPYQLSADGKDCISIKIAGGGVFLDKADFFVSQQ